MEEPIPEEASIRTGSSGIGSIMYTVTALIAIYPATVFLLQYGAYAENTGALVVGGFFAIVAVAFWAAALWG